MCENISVFDQEAEGIGSITGAVRMLFNQVDLHEYLLLRWLILLVQLMGVTFALAIAFVLDLKISLMKRSILVLVWLTVL